MINEKNSSDNSSAANSHLEGEEKNKEEQRLPFHKPLAAYIVADVKITDPEQFAEYRKLSIAAFEAHGVKPLAAAGTTERLEGREPGLIVVLPFDSMDAARKFYESEEYRKARSSREGAAIMNILIVEGV
jgi:uncharacterized protein (DUF1330 family)